MRQPKGFIVAMPVLVVLVIVALAAAAGSYWYAQSKKTPLVNSSSSITNFIECEAAGYPVMGSYPRQCVANGQSFVEDITVNTNTTAAANANVAVNANTNTATDPTAGGVSYNVTNATILATARNDEKDASKIHLKKVDTSTGKMQKEAVLNVGKLEVIGGSHGSWGSANSVQFGTDGDSLVFNATPQPGMSNAGYSYSSLYLTSFTNPVNKQRILHYDNAGKDTLTYVGQWKYDAKNHRVVYIETKNKSEKYTYTLRLVDTQTQETRNVATNLKGGLLVAVDDSSAKILVAEENDTRATLTTISLETGETLSTQTAFVQSELYQGSGSSEYDQRSLSPDGKKFAVWSDVLNIHTFNTDTYLFITDLGKVQNFGLIWSPDSAFVLVTMKDGGKVYKLDTGVTGTIKSINYPYIWAPGKYLVFARGPEDNWSIYRFDAGNNTSLKLELDAVHPGSYIGFDWVSS